MTSKVTLTKSAPKISLDKKTSQGTMRVNLNWRSETGQKKGFFKRAAENQIDLDLACLWEAKNGDKGVVQALGNSFGATDRVPFLTLDGDDRSGSNTDGENLSINLDKFVTDMRRVLVFAYIYEGAPSWDKAAGVVTMYPADGSAPVEVNLDETDNGKRFCAVAMLTNDNGNVVVEREVKYIAGSQAQLDAAYGWGMNWRPASK